MTLPRDIQLNRWHEKAHNLSDLKKQKADLENEVNLDPMTQLYNRRLFARISNDLDHISHIGIVIFDADNFKQINDRFGHDKGDEVLKRIAQVIKSNCHDRLPSTEDKIRPLDYPFRLGGDEFALILTNIKPEDTTKVVDRITGKLKQENISLSSGFAVTSENLSFQEAFVQADQNMYQDKQSRQVGR